MKLSSKGRYAVTAMLDLAVNANDRQRVTLADISEFQGISLSYLEQLFARLRQAQLVKGMRGPGGGYRLARPADEITIAQIITAVDDIGGKERPMNIDPRHQRTEELWQILSQRITRYLGNITLGDLVDDQDTSASDSAKQLAGSNSIDAWARTPAKRTTTA